MNIFEIFAAGDGRINEPNMTSALSFLLNPNSSHGLGLSALTEFLAPVSIGLIAQAVTGRSPRSFREMTLRQLLNRFERIELTLEECVFSRADVKGRRLREIDLTIRCYGDSVAPELVIAIENKITSSSANDPKQLVEEYQFLRQKLDDDFPADGDTLESIPILFIYITPDDLSGPSLAQWNALPLSSKPDTTNKDFKQHYTWKLSKGGASKSASLTEIARSLLRREQEGDISPASSHASLFLRSMVKFIENDFMTESAKLSEFVSVNSAKEVINALEFWAAWDKFKPGSRDCAQAIYEDVNKLLPKASLSQADPKIEVIFTKTRVGFFRGGERPIAIMIQNPTTNGRVAIQVKAGSDPSFTKTLMNFKKSSSIDYKLLGLNFEVQIPIEISSEELGRLVKALIDQLP